MSEKVSILLVMPSGSGQSTEAQETLQGISAQTYPTELTEVIKVEYMPFEPGANTSALNAAREQATGSYVVHAHLGVVWDGNKIEQQVISLQANPSASACVHCMTVRDGSERNWSLDMADISRYGPRIGCVLDAPWGPSAALLKRETVDLLGVYRNVPEVLWEFAIRFIYGGHELDVLDSDLAVWNVTPSNRPPERPRRLVPQQVRHPFIKSYLDRIAFGDLLHTGDDSSESSARLVQAGLYQRIDDLEACHTICQEVSRDRPCAEADYLHGIVHRREPDFQNARGWFRKAGGLGMFSEIREQVVGYLLRVLQIPDFGKARDVALEFLRHLEDRKTWDPLYFLELCLHNTQNGMPEETRLMEEIQEIEFRVLFDWTYRSATRG